MPFTVGIDVGGTFTDLVAVDAASGALKIAKVPTTPA
jgi:N-methylhydantoinase A